MTERPKDKPKAAGKAKPDDPAASVQAWERWERAFVAKLRQDATADRAWSKIETASKAGLNLDQIVAHTLFEATTYSDYVSHYIGDGLASQNTALKAAHRADAISIKRSGEPRAEMFQQRRKEALQRAARTPWPFQNPNVETLGDAESAYPEIGAKALHQAVSSKRADSLRRWGPRKIMLAMLRAGLRFHKVELSPRALSALASCADPDWQIDERTLRRFFREPMMQVAEQGYIELFNSLLDRFEVSLSQHLSNS